MTAIIPAQRSAALRAAADLLSGIAVETVVEVNQRRIEIHIPQRIEPFARVIGLAMIACTLDVEPVSREVGHLREPWRFAEGTHAGFEVKVYCRVTHEEQAELASLAARVLDEVGKA